MSGQPTHGLSYLPEYRVWLGMRQRCTDPNHPAYPRYGGRGITICQEWLDEPDAFIEHVGPRPSSDHEIDRIDNERGYQPGNVRWATRTESSRNRRNNRPVEFRGETRLLCEWCEALLLPSDTVRKRLEAGWSPEAALRTPVRAKRPNGSGRPPRRRSSELAPLFLDAAE